MRLGLGVHTQSGVAEPAPLPLAAFEYDTRVLGQDENAIKTTFHPLSNNSEVSVNTVSLEAAVLPLSGAGSAVLTFAFRYIGGEGDLLSLADSDQFRVYISNGLISVDVNTSVGLLNLQTTINVADLDPLAQYFISFKFTTTLLAYDLLQDLNELPILSGIAGSYTPAATLLFDADEEDSFLQLYGVDTTFTGDVYAVNFQTSNPGFVPWLSPQDFMDGGQIDPLLEQIYAECSAFTCRAEAAPYDLLEGLGAWDTLTPTEFNTTFTMVNIGGSGGGPADAEFVESVGVEIQASCSIIKYVPLLSGNTFRAAATMEISAIQGEWEITTMTNKTLVAEAVGTLVFEESWKPLAQTFIIRALNEDGTYATDFSNHSITIEKVTVNRTSIGTVSSNHALSLPPIWKTSFTHPDSSLTYGSGLLVETPVETLGDSYTLCFKVPQKEFLFAMQTLTGLMAIRQEYDACNMILEGANGPARVNWYLEEGDRSTQVSLIRDGANFSLYMGYTFLLDKATSNPENYLGEIVAPLLLSSINSAGIGAPSVRADDTDYVEVRGFDSALSIGELYAVIGDM
jgi:hypothetical protein